MKITDISLFRITGSRTGPTFPPGDRQARALDVYPELNQKTGGTKPSTDVQRMRAIYVEIRTDDGISGL